MYDPTKLQYRVERGKYSAIKASKGKRMDTVYFGYDASDSLLNGIFLGDFELTSKVKGVSYIEDGDYLHLSIQYANKLGLIETLTTTMLNKKYIPMIAEFFSITLGIIDSSLSQIKEDIESIEKSVEDVSIWTDRNFNDIEGKIQNLDNYDLIIDSSITEIREMIGQANYDFSQYLSLNDSSIQSLSEDILNVSLGISIVNTSILNIENKLVWNVLD